MTSLSARGHGASSGQKRLMNASFVSGALCTVALQRPRCLSLVLRNGTAAAQGVTNADPDPSHWIPILSQERKDKRQRRPMRLSPDFQWPCVLPQAVQGWVPGSGSRFSALCQRWQNLGNRLPHLSGARPNGAGEGLGWFCAPWTEST
ncbi:hypothetical protein CIHG_01947 [Coccidioides immitis H538.4]|uniref:Uncharacterized protein n=2 Tax=Coccidioides immitis TaxID=5501 RepID=A0A0J8QR68_COCIT|nr:hypothetical protein CISG_03788 [Coccidioides immitis RMSCC 3703]KMU84161.1 hypothetical protein CIHG_01947 [Coccidioides immitis H538.4]